MPSRPRAALAALAFVALACAPARRGGSDEPVDDRTDPPPAACGNGVLDPGETCDPKIASGAGACPGACDDGDPCTTDGRGGAADKCTAKCVFTLKAGDPACVPTCGNGRKEFGETCDGDCPTACDDGDPCTTDALSGSAGACSAACSATRIPGCGDTPERCGNGVVDAGEACDPAIASGVGACPTSCAAPAACERTVLEGSPAACSARCVPQAISACASGDGCCPSGCTNATDSECAPIERCGNGVLDANETCDRAIPAGLPGACPTACDDSEACTTDVLQGTVGSCTRACGVTPVTRCVSGDGCCPTGCFSPADTECPLAPNPYIGRACAADSECGSGGFCGTEAESGFTGGYCSRACATDADCGAGSLCDARAGESSGVCYRACATNAECAGRSGYECYDFVGDARPECGPVGQGTVAVGGACTNYGQCAGGRSALCLVDSRGYPGGYCMRRCDSGQACPAGSHCDSRGGCVATCTSGASCRQNYACVDGDGDGKSECDLSGTGTGAVGVACRYTSDCAGGTDAVCANGWDGGACLLDCSAKTCPTGSACTTFEGGSKYCLQVCTGTGRGSCREGFTCGAIADDSFSSVCYQ